jgi:mannitol/fructose-specific phosphotransferase system IIA component (Ntr-type)
MTFWKLFKPKACSVGLKSSTKETVLREIVATMVEGGALAAELAPAAVLALEERERMASTGVGMNVAIPHVKLVGLEQAVATVCVHPAGVEWAAVDGDVVHVFFTVLRPDEAALQHDPQRHLEMMRWIARLSRDRDFRRFAIGVRTRTELVDLLKEKSSV